MNQELIEKLNSISEDFEKAIAAKCDELGYDKNKGIISLEETFINLNSIKESLYSAANSDKLSQFPITFQKELITRIGNTLKFGTEIVSGTDSIINFIDSVEVLHALLWQYRFYQISTEEVELTKRINAAKHLEVELAQKRELLDVLLAKKGEVEKIETEIVERNGESEKLSLAITETLSASKTLLTQVTTTKENATKALTSIEETKKDAEEKLDESEASKKAITGIEKAVEKFFERIDTYQKKMDEVSGKADTTVEKNNTETGKIAVELTRLEGLIKDQIEKATGYSLFHSFQKRKDEIVESKNAWSKILIVLVIASVVLSLIIGFTSKNIDLWLYVKLSFTLPVAYAIAFVNVQYSKERRLEEEYAFKSNISLSLVPYKELIEKTIDKDDPESRKKYNGFLIQMIEKIFTSPTDGITSTAESDPSKTLDSLGKALETVVKPLQPLLKAMKS